MADNYLITGYWGEPHITPENDRGINASMFGAGKFVLPVGEKFRVEYIGNNTVRMYDGKLIDNGAAAGIPVGEYIDILIPNASQGMIRTDIIAFQYEKDPSTFIETGKFVLLNGEEVEFDEDSVAETGELPAMPEPELITDDLLSDKAILDQFALWRIIVHEGNIHIGIDDYVEPRMFSFRPNTVFTSLKELGISDSDMQGVNPDMPSLDPFNFNIYDLNAVMPNYSKLKTVLSPTETPNLFDSFIMKLIAETELNYPLTSGGAGFGLAIEVSKFSGVNSPVKIEVTPDNGLRDRTYSCIWDKTGAGTIRVSSFSCTYASPIMTPGVEYKTSEFWNGKVLYTQLLVTTWTAGGNVDYSINTEVVRYSGKVGGHTIPFIFSTLENQYTGWASFYNHSGKLRLMMQGGSSLNGLTAQIQIWYMK